MKPLHPQVRVTMLPNNRLAYVELYDGRLWLRATKALVAAALKGVRNA